jgi:hypothetical protein
MRSATRRRGNESFRTVPRIFSKVLAADSADTVIPDFHRQF